MTAAGDELTAEEIVEEKEVQKKQLEEIQKLMEEKVCDLIWLSQTISRLLEWIFVDYSQNSN